MAAQTTLEPITISLEEALPAMLKAMRREAEERSAHLGDYFGPRAKALLDGRPLIFLAYATPMQVLGWAVEPGDEGLVIGAHAVHYPRDGDPPLFAHADINTNDRGFLWHTIEDNANWLVREAFGGPPILSENEGE